MPAVAPVTTTRFPAIAFGRGSAGHQVRRSREPILV